MNNQQFHAEMAAIYQRIVNAINANGGSVRAGYDAVMGESAYLKLCCNVWDAANTTGAA